MTTANQLLAHAIGDYIVQNHWMATGKTTRWIPALLHALTYSLVFLLFRPSFAAWAVIFGTHLLIDRFRLARYVCWAKNGGGARTATGYPAGTPEWMAAWLVIIVDNIIHICINGAALRWL